MKFLCPLLEKHVRTMSYVKEQPSFWNIDFEYWINIPTKVSHSPILIVHLFEWNELFVHTYTHAHKRKHSTVFLQIRSVRR